MRYTIPGIDLEIVDMSTDSTIIAGDRQIITMYLTKEKDSELRGSVLYPLHTNWGPSDSLGADKNRL